MAKPSRRTKTKSAAPQNAVQKTPLPKLAQPALRALSSAGIDHLEQLSHITESSLAELHGIGPNAITTLRNALDEKQLSFAMTQPDEGPLENFSALWSEDRHEQGAAYQHYLELTVQPVTWAYEVWDELLQQTNAKNSRNRSIAAQLLCQLSASDPQNRMLKDFPKLYEVLLDERFVTARHTLQAMWRIGRVSKRHQDMLLKSLERRFSECATHKNSTLIRYDIIECLRKLFDDNQSAAVQSLALSLIETEPDAKYQKKYRSLWAKK